MNFNMPGGPMDPNGMNPQYFKMNGGMDPNMVSSMPNGMRPPSSHPAAGRFNNQMTPQQQMVMAQQQQQQQAGGVQNWPNGPNGQMMPQPGAQGTPQQTMGTPQQRAMPPPSAPATGAAANGRTQPPSPQQNAAPPTPSQTNKANPKKKNESKDSKAKVYSIALNGYFCGNVDIDNSGLQRKDPPQTSMLVLHRLPMPKPLVRHRRPQHRSPLSTRRPLTVRTALSNQLRTAKHPDPLQTQACSRSQILYRVVHSVWATLL
jgi:hypothetical protein